RPRRPRRALARDAALRARRARRLLRRRQPRRRPDQGEPAVDRGDRRARRRGRPAAQLAPALLRCGRGRRAAGVARGPPVPRRRLLHDALRDQALEPPRGEPPAARREVVRRRGLPRPAAVPAAGARRGVAAPALQPVPRHARRHVDRAGVRGRTRPDRSRDLDRRARVQPRRAVDREPRRRPVRRGLVSAARLQPAPVAAADRRRARVQLDEARGRSSRRRCPAPADAVADDDERESRAARLSGGRAAAPAAGLDATDTTVENDYVLLELDPASGRIARLVHKESGADVAGSGAHASVVNDRSDTWGHEVRAYDDVIGEFACRSVRLVENGPVRAVLRVESSYGASTLREDYILSAHARHVDVVVSLDWHEQLKLLKLRYPTNVESPIATFE